MTRILPNLTLLILSLVSSLIMVEICVRTVAPQSVSGSWRTSSPTGLLVNKSAGSAQHQYGDRIVQYRFYPPHLRDTALTNRGHRVLALGDSFTFGWLLNGGDTFVGKLQKLVDLEFGEGIFSLVNAAAGGWGTADYVAYVEEFGRIVQPEIIIVFLNTDDIGRSLNSGLYSFVDRDSLTLERHRVEPDVVKRITELIPFYDWLLANLHSVQLLRNAYFLLGSGETPRKEKKAASPLDLAPHFEALDRVHISQAVELAKALFLRLKGWADENGSELYVTTSGWHRPPYDEGPLEPTRAFMVLAERFFEQAGIPYNDVSHDVLRVRVQAPESFIIPDDGHPNERGSELIARSVWPFVRERLSAFCARQIERAGAGATPSTGRTQLVKGDDVQAPCSIRRSRAVGRLAVGAIAERRDYHSGAFSRSFYQSDQVLR